MEEFRNLMLAGILKKRYKWPTPISVATILRCCEKLGLVKETRREPSPLRGEMFRWRKYYKIINPMAREWEDPITAYYRPAKFSQTRYTKQPLVVSKKEFSEIKKEHIDKLHEGYLRKVLSGWKPTRRKKYAKQIE